MLDVIVMLFSKLSLALGQILNLEVPLTSSTNIKFGGIVAFVFILFAFVKFVQTIMRNGTYGSHK